VVLSFNEWDQTEEILHQHRHEIAAVIMEPIQGGFIPPDETFLKRLRELTHQYGIVLIFDEVKTGFRTGLSGAQGIYGVVPDLTAHGKVLGGGFPVGAVGGREEIMELCSPANRVDILTTEQYPPSSNHDNPLFHSGTYNGHPVVLTAGLATIQVLRESEVYPQLEANTAQLRNGMVEILNRYGIASQTVGVGSIFNLVLSSSPPNSGCSGIQFALTEEIGHALVKPRIFIKPLNRFSLSTAHTSEVIHETLERFEIAVKSLVESRDTRVRQA
jgi:glutamate-1-semialdehyde 2,1-aminomutase